METFGALLRRRRLARGLTLRQLALRADCAPSYISKLETGDRLPPSRKMTAAFARALGVAEGSAEWDRFFLLTDHVPPGIEGVALLLTCQMLRRRAAA